MNPYGPNVTRLIDEFEALPGIGRKSAERLANYILGCTRPKAMGLAEAIRAVKESVHACPECFNLTEKDVCDICSDPRRDHQLLCIVEQPKDMLALEASGVFQGVYHVL